MNTRWPWITPAQFRPELVPEELMAQGLTVSFATECGKGCWLTEKNFFPANGRRIRSLLGNAGQRLSLHHLQRLLQARPLRVDLFRVQRSTRPPVFRPERHRTVQLGSRLAIPQRSCDLPVHVGEIAIGTRTGAMPGIGE